jgi:hypothetical protein
MKKKPDPEQFDTALEFLPEGKPMSYDDVISEVLGRYSVMDLREMTEKDLARGDEMYEKHAAGIKVLESGTANLIRWWKIASGDKEYEVRRFENFVFCSCLDFFFNKTVCKHICVTVDQVCVSCRIHAVEAFGSTCEKCQIGTSLEIGDRFKIIGFGYGRRDVYEVVEIVDSPWPYRCCIVGYDPSRSSATFSQADIDSYKAKNALKILPSDPGRQVTHEKKKLLAA